MPFIGSATHTRRRYEVGAWGTDGRFTPGASTEAAWVANFGPPGSDGAAMAAEQTDAGLRRVATLGYVCAFGSGLRLATGLIAADRVSYEGEWYEATSITRNSRIVPHDAGRLTLIGAGGVEWSGAAEAALQAFRGWWKDTMNAADGEFIVSDGRGPRPAAPCSRVAIRTWGEAPTTPEAKLHPAIAMQPATDAAWVLSLTASGRTVAVGGSSLAELLEAEAAVNGGSWTDGVFATALSLDGVPSLLLYSTSRARPAATGAAALNATAQVRWWREGALMEVTGDGDDARIERASNYARADLIRLGDEAALIVRADGPQSLEAAPEQGGPRGERRVQFQVEYTAAVADRVMEVQQIAPGVTLSGRAVPAAPQEG